MTFSFEYHLKALIYLHLQEYESGRELLQVLEEDEFAKEYIAPPDGVGRSTFFEAMNTRALPQLIKMYELLQQQAKDILPVSSPELGNFVAVDGSLIDAVPTMEFADYRTGVKKAKVHLGFDLNHGIPERIAFKRVVHRKLDYCFPLPELKPKITRNLGIVFIGFAVPFDPGVKFTLCNRQPGYKALQWNLGLVAPLPGVINNGITGVMPALAKSLTDGVIKDVAVFPQGLGGLRDYLDGLPERPTGNVLGIDIGFNTIIFTLFSPQKKQIIHGKTLNKRGVHQMATSFLLPRIKNLAPSGTFTPVEIAFLIEKGYLQYGFERHDVTREIQEAGVAYIEHIIRDIQGELQAHVGMHADFDRVLLFGGGAAFLKNGLPARNIEVIVLPEPEYANARGFQTLAFAKGV